MIHKEILLIKLERQPRIWFCSDLNELHIAFLPKEGTILKEIDYSLLWDRLDTIV